MIAHVLAVFDFLSIVVICAFALIALVQTLWRVLKGK